MPRGGRRPGAGRKRVFCALCRAVLPPGSDPSRKTCSDSCRTRLSRFLNPRPKQDPKPLCSQCGERRCHRDPERCSLCRQRKGVPPGRKRRSVFAHLLAGTYQAHRHGPIPDELVGLIWPRPFGPRKPPRSKIKCTRCGAGSRSHEACTRCKRVCAVCGGVKICSTALRCLDCYSAAHAAAKRVCKGCGAMFARGGRGTYCSRACSDAHRIDWSRRPPRKEKPPPPPRLCALCGGERPRLRVRYCSDGCASLVVAQRKAAEQRKRLGTASGEAPYVCITCGSSGRGRKGRLYCSHACRHRMRKYAHLWAGLSGAARAEMISTAATLKRFNRAYNDVYLQKGNADG
jgi:hypothetical protein